jgi:hypothetical protein
MLCVLQSMYIVYELVLCIVCVLSVVFSTRVATNSVPVVVPMVTVITITVIS